MPDTNNSTSLSSIDVFSLGMKVMGCVLLLGSITKSVSTIGSIIMSYSTEYAKHYIHPIYDIRALTLMFLNVAIAIVLLSSADKIARALAGNDELLSTPREGLCIALKIVGIYLVAVGVPRAIEYLADVYSIGSIPLDMSTMLGGVESRSFRNGDLMRHGPQWSSIAKYSLNILIGVYLITGSRHLLDLAYGRLPFVEEAEEVV